MLARLLRRPAAALPALLLVFSLLRTAAASVGDRSPEFRECVDVCVHANCDPRYPTNIPIYRELLFWTCPQECDYACQHIVTTKRLERDEPVVQFHGKWPFIRLFGMQEPFSVLFSLGNLAAHQNGLAKIRSSIPADYPLRRYYVLFAYVGTMTWIFSSIFHTRDFVVTEQLDYFAAGANVLYGLYYTPIVIFRLDRRTPRHRSLLRLWTILCCGLYIAHVTYLKLWKWNYGYNIAANVVVGLIHNLLWTYFSWKKYRETHMAWAIWPGCAVAWIMLVMSFELLDFPPVWSAIDAHSLWHLGTIFPTILWYNFLIKDAQDDIATSKDLKK